MRQRCRDRRATRFPQYGGRGITICERWDSFDLFLEDMGPPPAGSSLERLDVNGHYTPQNCVWATVDEQANNKTSNHWIVFQGQRKTMMQWAKELGVGYYTLRGRLRAGWDVESALTKPSRPIRRKQRGRRYLIDGQNLTLTEWCRLTSVPISTADTRLGRGCTIEQALGLSPRSPA